MRAYAAHRDRLLVVDDLDGDPAATEQLVDRRLECVDAHERTPEVAYVGTFGDGLFRTTDGGTSFESIGAGIEQDAVTAVAVAPTDPETVWVGTEPSRLYRSTDGGDSFERVGGILDVDSADEWSFPPRPDTHHVRTIAPDHHDEYRVYVGIEAGALLVTNDGGESWLDRPRGSRRDNHELRTHPDVPGAVYSAAGDGYAESTDGGESWSHPQQGLEHRYVWSVLPDPGDSNRVLVSAASGASDAHREPGESYYYRREDERWERLEGIPSGSGVLRAVLAGDGTAGHAYAMTNHGLYRSADFGTTWTAVDVAWPEVLTDQTARGLAVVP